MSKKKLSKSVAVLPPEVEPWYLPLLIPFLIYLAVFSILVLTNNSFGLMGDFSYSVGTLTANRIYFFKNSFFSLPYYTPMFGGGIPAYADPQDMYFSIPQAAFLVFSNPQTAFKFAFGLSLFLSHTGFYKLLRRFEVSPRLAFFGAAVYALNGFIWLRWFIGHLGFHATWVHPWILLNVHRLFTRPEWMVSLKCSAWIALLLSVLVYGADINDIYFFVMLTTTFLFSLVIRERRWSSIPFVATWMAAAGLLALLITASKQMAVLDYMRHFPRKFPNDEIYFMDALWLIPHSLFDFTRNLNSQAPLPSNPGWHEYGAYIGVTSGLAIFIFFQSAFRKKKIDIPPTIRNANGFFGLWAAVLTVSVGYFIQGDTLFWDIVKDWPLLSSYHFLARMLGTLPLAILAFVFSLYDRWKQTGEHPRAALVFPVLCLIEVSLYGAYVPKEHTNKFRPWILPERSASVSVERWVPRSFGEFIRQNQGDSCVRHPQFTQLGKPCSDVDPNLPPLHIHPDGTYNVTDPTSVIYSKEMWKHPFKRLKVEGNEEKVKKFLRFEDPGFFVPKRQIWANRVSLAALLSCLGFLLLFCLKGLRRHPELAPANPTSP